MEQVSCTTFPRRFGRRYQDAAPPAAAARTNPSDARYGTGTGGAARASIDGSSYVTPSGTPYKIGRSGGNGAAGDVEASPHLPPPPLTEVDPDAVTLDPALKAGQRLGCRL